MKLVKVGEWPGSEDPPVSLRAVHVAGGHAYLADYSYGLRILNLRDLSNPVESKSLGFTGAQDVYAVDDWVYVVAKSQYVNGLRAVDVSDLDNPVVKGFTAEGGLTRVFGGNGQVYAVGGSTVYAVYDGRLENVFSGAGAILDGCVVGNRAYLTTGQAGDSHLTAMDVSNPLKWEPLKTVSLPTTGEGLFARDGRLFIANNYSGLRIKDVTDLRDISVTGTGDMARDVRTDAKYAYVAAHGNGLVVLDISNPSNPQAVASHNTPGQAQGLFVDDRYIYVADGTGGLQILLLNHVPDAPEAVSPRDGETVDSLNPELQAAFSDPDGDEPVSVTWQVYGEGLSAVFEFEGFTREGDTLEAQVPGDVRLEYGKTYAWRVGCTVPYEQEVLWGEWASFVTPEAPPTPPAGDDPPDEDDPGQGPDPPAQDDPPDDPPPAPRRHRHRAEPRTVPPPPPVKLWQQGMITVSFNPCRSPAPYLVSLPLPVPTSDPGSGALDLYIPGGLTLGFTAPAGSNMAMPSRQE